MQPAAQPETAQPGGITEEELKQWLVGKVLYLRGGYLDESLSFNEHGVLSGHSPQGSYTLSGVAIEKVHLTKHKVELEGQRYGLHFLGALPSEDPTTAMDRVLITPKKKVLRITIDREIVVAPKKIKEKSGKSAPAAAAHPAQASAAQADAALASPSPQPAEPSEADQAKAEMAAAPAAERPADPASVTTTTSPAHATALLKDAIDRIFSVGFDDRMMAAMPDFWKLYYQAVAAKSDYRPNDPAVLRQNAVDKKARLVSVFEPASNEYAQSHGVAGLALYHVVIGADGKPGEIAVARPIGFGLDESAAASIRKASFEPAIKDGKPVPVLLDLIVEFHIYSGLTGGSSKPAPGDHAETAPKPDAADESAAPVLPGPYSVPHPQN
jgi:outer membrane biosynthesis protein TonB